VRKRKLLLFPVFFAAIWKRLWWIRKNKKKDRRWNISVSKLFFFFFNLFCWFWLKHHSENNITQYHPMSLLWHSFIDQNEQKYRERKEIKRKIGMEVSKFDAGENGKRRSILFLFLIGRYWEERRTNQRLRSNCAANWNWYY